MAFPPMFHEKEPERAVRVKPGLMIPAVRLGSVRGHIAGRQDKIRAQPVHEFVQKARRTFLGKTVQAFLNWMKCPACKQDTWASDPVGWDRRSRFGASTTKKELKLPFSTLMTRKPKQGGVRDGRT